MQHPEPDDFVIATGETHSVREFVEAAFARVGIHDWQKHVALNDDLKRPAEVDLLCGDASKSKRLLGFEPKVKFLELVHIMVDAEMAKLQTSHSDDRRDLQTFPEAKLIRVKKDTVIGGHFHLKKQEKFILSEGECVLHLRVGLHQTPHRMQIGRIYTVEPGQYHEFHVKAGSVLVGFNSRAFDASDDYRIEQDRAA
jgi:mannose-6-phosphate isomerase-like protein (cupin superfamily)